VLKKIETETKTVKKNNARTECLKNKKEVMKNSTKNLMFSLKKKLKI